MVVPALVGERAHETGHGALQFGGGEVEGGRVVHDEEHVHLGGHRQVTHSGDALVVLLTNEFLFAAADDGRGEACQDQKVTECCFGHGFILKCQRSNTRAMGK